MVHPLPPERGAYLYVIDGGVTLDGESLATGDAAKVVGEESLRIQASVPSELILVDVPMRFEPVGVWAGRV